MRRTIPGVAVAEAVRDGNDGAAGAAPSHGAGAGGVAPAPPPLQTEFDFDLPRGYVDGDGVVHRSGTMRLATARDELLPLYDARVKENAAFTTVVLLARVVTRLGSLTRIDSSVIESMFASDVAFLQDLYRRINAEGHTRAAVTCPSCAHAFAVDIAGGRLGES